jgi:V/A-type H+-transporting ATPase subunit F
MSRLIVIADQDTALGFQLAGAEVIRTLDYESGRSNLLKFLSDPTVGLIAVSSVLVEKLDDATRRRVEMSYKPVVVALPAGGPVMGFASRREYLATLIRRAVGFHLTFDRE